MNTVFILGAGASAHARIPLMPEFLEVVEDIFRVADPNWSEYDSFKLVVDARAQLSDVHSKAQFDIRNLESVYAAFEMAAIFGALGELPAEDVARLVEAIQRVIVATIERRMVLDVRGGAIQAPNQYTWFAALIRQMIDEKRVPVSIITFNYDVALDLALRAQQLDVDYCELPEPRIAGQDPTIELMKLHGSVNFTTCTACNSQILYRDVLEAARDVEASLNPHGGPGTSTLPVSQQLATLEHCGGQHCRPHPLIVPPTTNKAGYRKAIAPVWRRAAQRLREAENIFVMGYSWPASDQFFRQLYALGTVGRTILRRMWIFNPDPTVRERFKASLLGQQAIDRMGARSEQDGNFDVVFNRAAEYVASAFGVTAGHIGQGFNRDRLRGA